MPQHSADLPFDDLPVIAARLDEAGRIVAVNRAWRDFALANGYATDDLGVGRNYIDICRSAIGPRSRYAATAADGIAAVLSGSRDGFSLQYDCHSPTERHWYKLIVGRTDDPPGAVVLHTDVTTEAETAETLDRRRAEAEAAKLRAEQVMEARSRFLTAAGHDLRQPLQAAELFLDVLRGAVVSGTADPAHAGPLIDHLGTALGALREILEGLNDLSTLDSGTLPVTVTRFPIQAVLDQLAAEAHVLGARAGLGVRAARCSAWVETDRELLARIGRNLLSNAIRYTPSGRVLIGARRRGDKVELCVCDTGTGIAPDQIGAIFEEFYQVRNPERDRRKGLGLGLSIVRRLVNLLGLSISVTSQPGQGSCFRVAVPRAPGAGGAPIAAPAPIRADIPQ